MPAVTTTTSTTTTATTTTSSDTTVPSAPTNLTATGLYSKISLTWSASSDNVGVAGYNVYRDGIAPVFATATSTNYVNINIAPVEVHNYTVAAYDQAGNISAKSSSASAITLATAITTTATTTAATDTLGPWLNSLSITPTSGKSGMTVTFTMTAEDPSGINYVIFNIKYPDGYGIEPRCNFNGVTSGACTFIQPINRHAKRTGATWELCYTNNSNGGSVEQYRDLLSNRFCYK